MKNFNQEINCAEMKLSMIESILQMDCKNWTGNKINTKSLDEFFLKHIEMDEEIPEKTKVDEVDNLGNFSSLMMPPSFFIEDIQEVFEDNIFSSDYIHVYFIKNPSEISLLFRFNMTRENDSDTIGFGADEALYELKNRRLITISAANATTYINDFKTLYDNQNFSSEETEFTQYVTFHHDKIRRNFKKFENTTQLISAAKSDPTSQKLRLNLILQIVKANCKNPVTSSANAYFNVGNMQP